MAVFSRYLAGEVPPAQIGGPSRGYLYKTTDGGSTWNRVYHLVGSDLRKIVMVNSTIGFAIGTDGIVLKTIDNGQTWDLINSWSTSGMIVDLNDIHFMDNGSGNYTVTVVGNNGLVAQSTDLQNFTAISIGNGWDLQSVSASNSHYFTTANSNVGTNTATIFTRLISGGSWIESNNFAVVSDINSVDITSGNKAIMAGADGRIYTNMNVSSSNSRWLMKETNLIGSITDIQFVNDLFGAAIVNDKLFKTSDGGTNWVQISTDNYKHISESSDGVSILAVGPNNRISLVVSALNTLLPNIPLPISVSGLDCSVGWIDHIGYGFNGSSMFVISTGTDLYFSDDATNPMSSWGVMPLSSFLSGQTIKDFKFERSNPSSNDAKGLILTDNGKLLKVSSLLSPPVIINSTGQFFNSIDKDISNSIVYALDSNGVLSYLDLNASTNSLTTLTNIASINQKCLLVSGNYAIVAGNEILQISLSTSTTTNQTVATNPIALSSIDFVNNNMIAIGKCGTIYQEQSGTWKLMKSSTNKNLNAVAFYNGKYYFVGDNGYFKMGILASDTFSSSPLTLTSGGTVESTIAESLYDIALNGGKMYVVGQVGRVLYSPNASTSNFAKLNFGTSTLTGIYPKQGSQKMISVGESETILEIVGSSFIERKELFTPTISSVNFMNTNTGTVIGDNFTIRKTNDGGVNWTSIKPNSNVSPGSMYSEVLTLNSNESFIFGQGTPMISYAEIAQNIGVLSSYQNVTDLAVYENQLFILNTDELVIYNLNSGTVSTSISLGGDANALEVLNNGSCAVTGANGYFEFFNPNQISVFTSSIGSEDFNDLKFIDNVTAVAVGDNGAFYKFTGTGVTLDGYPTNGNWNAQSNFYASGVDPIGVNAYGQVNIYTVDYSSSTNGLFGGEYLNSNFDNAASCYVRKVYDAHERYSARFYYDKLGRLVVSQNARQYNTLDIYGNAKERKYSYTIYDQLGRVIEVGEKTENESNSSGNQVQLTFEDIFGTNISGYYNPSMMDDTKLLVWIQGQGPRKEVTKSYYDKSVISGLPTTFSPDSLTQRKRITHVTYEAIFDGNDQTYDHATHYDYDIHGNVKTLLQDNLKMATDFASVADQRFKRMDYVYDLVSGNVHRMSVQSGEIDQWHHAYRYDADNRILSAHTTTETPILNGSNSAQALENELVQNTDWEQDAKYLYYDHGPLSRVELGNNQVQGMDYIYNLQGWMKGVNATTLDQNIDPGKDGLSEGSNTINGSFATDVMAFSLHYHDQDYNPIGSNGTNPSIISLPAASIENSDITTNSYDLFNGNIKAMQTTLTDPITNEILPMANAYLYDQLNRLLESKSFINLSGNQWENSGSYDNRYLNTFEYDAMGNIIHQNRYTADGDQIEDMSYGYKRNSSGELLRNRLYHINEPDILTGLSDSDIDNMPGTFNPQDQNIDTSYNYMYDEEGRLVRDKQEQIDKIIWRVDGKVKEIRRPQGSEKKNLSFDYDAMGNRIAKHVYDDDWNLKYTTYYILDAQGNQLSVYNHEVSGSNVSYNLRERHIYGSSALGIRMDSLDVNSIFTGNTLTELGKKTYSMSNHLGNVLAVVSDIKIPLSTDGNTVESYRVGIRNISDYSPFGVLLAERTVEGAFFRNGFQGQESDDEVKGEGNSVNFSYRMHDPRVGRWLSCDAHKSNYPAWAPYASNGNNPIVNLDIDGQDFIFFAGAGYKGEKEEKKFNTSFTYTMSEILDDNFSIVPGVNRGGLRDVFWGIKNGWTPISNLTSNEILQRSVDHVEKVIQGLECGEPLNMVGSSYGSVTAAQTALYILEHKDEYLQNDVKVSLTLSSKMLDENSPLMLALINEARNNPNFTLLFQDFPEDNVNGIASGKILGNQGLKSIIFPHKQADGTRQDSMLNPNGDHTHTIMGQSTAKTYDLIKFMLYEHQLEGLATAERSITILGQNSNLPDRKDPECLDTILESPSKNHSVPKY